MSAATISLLIQGKGETGESLLEKGRKHGENISTSSPSVLTTVPYFYTWYFIKKGHSSVFNPISDNPFTLHIA